MGRLEDIIERNRDPAAARRKSAEPKPVPIVTAPKPASPGDANRLDNIIERNRNPGRAMKGRRLTLFVPLVLLIVLLLLIFTNLARAPEDETPADPGSNANPRVRDIRLWTPPARGSAGSATPR